MISSPLIGFTGAFLLMLAHLLDLPEREAKADGRGGSDGCR